MADEPDELSNEHILEGGEEIMSALDNLFDQQPPEGEKTEQVQEQKEVQQTTDQTTETPEQIAERTRNEKGQFTKEQQEEKDRVAKEQQSQQTTADKQYPAEIKSTKAREHFDALTKVKEEAVRRAETAESKFKQLETKVQELESKSGVAAPEVKVLQQENAKLKAELDEREKVISFKAVEETKAFREGVTAPQNEALDVLKQVSATYSIDGRKLDDVLNEPNKFKRLEMLGDLTAELPERSAFVKDELKQAVEKWVGAENVAKQLFGQAQGNREFAEQEKQQSEAKQALERQSQFQNANKEVDAILRQKFPEIAGDEAKWKEITEKAFKVADFDRLPPKAKAFANVASWMIMPLMEKHRATLAELATVKETAAKRNGAMPSAGGGRATVAKTGDEETEDGSDPMSGLMSSLDAAFSGQR